MLEPFLLVSSSIFPSYIWGTRSRTLVHRFFWVALVFYSHYGAWLQGTAWKKKNKGSNILYCTTVFALLHHSSQYDYLHSIPLNAYTTFLGANLRMREWNPSTSDVWWRGLSLATSFIRRLSWMMSLSLTDAFVPWKQKNIKKKIYHIGHCIQALGENILCHIPYDIQYRLAGNIHVNPPDFNHFFERLVIRRWRHFGKRPLSCVCLLWMWSNSDVHFATVTWLIDWLIEICI